MAEYSGGPGITRFRAEYFHKDHLGNTRLAFSDFNQNDQIDLTEDDPGTPENELEITQEAHYYPFGMGHMGPWYATVAPENKYLYNGKELNEDYGINLMDYGARWYDGALGRFTGVDPLAEKAPEWSPYRYAFDNPVLFIDPDGMFEDEAVAKKYAKEHGIKVRPKSFLGKLFTSGSRSNIVKQSDGTFAIEHGKTSISDLGGDLGVMTSVVIKPTDVMDSKMEGDINNAKSTLTLRDGSLQEYNGPLLITGTAPTPGLKGVKGKTISRSVGKGRRLVMKLIKKGDDATDFSKTQAIKGPEWRPVTPNTQPKSKWKHVIDLVFGNFDQGY